MMKGKLAKEKAEAKEKYDEEKQQAHIYAAKKDEKKNAEKEAKLKKQKANDKEWVATKEEKLSLLNEDPSDCRDARKHTSCVLECNSEPSYQQGGGLMQR